MKKINIKMIRSKAFQASLTSFDGLGITGVGGKDFGNDKNAVAKTRDGLAHDFFDAAIAVHLSRIDVVGAFVDSRAKSLRGGLRILFHHPRTEADGREFGKHYLK